jgi:hypothetical protein
MDRLKLFVVGEESGDPDEWHESRRRVLVFAESAEQARGACHAMYLGKPVCEVKPLEPCVLYEEPPDWRD